MNEEEKDDEIWLRAGATLSDWIARVEFGLRQPEIYAAIQTGKLRFQMAQGDYGPYLRLLRHEVEDLVTEKRERGEPQPNTQLLELSLGEMDEVFVNVLAVFSFEKRTRSMQNKLSAYHQLLDWIARRKLPLTSFNQAGRYSLLTKMKRDLRAVLRDGGQQLLQIDVANSPWVFLALKMREDGVKCGRFIQVCERGELYKLVAEKVNTTREKAKKMLSWRSLFAANDDPCQGSIVKRAFDELFPEAGEYLFQAKQETDGRQQVMFWMPEFSQGSELAKALHTAEADFMVDKVVGRIRRERQLSFVARICDCLIVAPQGVDYLKVLMEEEFEKIGLHPILRAEEL